MGQARLFNIDDNTVEESESWPAVAKMIEECSIKDDQGKVDLKSYADLGPAADGGDSEAEAKLTEACEEAGIDPGEYETWVEVAELLDQGGEESEEDGETSESSEWSEVDRCAVDYDGTMYEGTVASIQDDTATVDFDDGSQEDCSLDDLQEPAESEGSEGEEPGPPEKGQVRRYKPPRSRKILDCEVTAVFTTTETCNLQDLDTGNKFQKVSWSKLLD